MKFRLDAYLKLFWLIQANNGIIKFWSVHKKVEIIYN